MEKERIQEAYERTILNDGKKHDKFKEKYGKKWESDIKTAENTVKTLMTVQDSLAKIPKKGFYMDSKDHLSSAIRQITDVNKSLIKFMKSLKQDREM
jgi:hypothetical protein